MVTTDTRRAERALHRRAGLACGAAEAAGVAGRFLVWEQAGLLAVVASDPALGFLSTMSGVDAAAPVLELLDSPVWGGVEPTVVVPSGMTVPGLVRVADRGLALRTLDETPAREDIRADDDFLPVLLAGYEVDGTVAAFIAAEHGLPEVHRFVAVAHDVPIAAAAMTIHDGVAVLGGASTLRAHRGKGAQPRLLRHRLRVAAEAGCDLAVATVVPDSVSAKNLARAGFTVHRRAALVRID